MPERRRLSFIARRGPTSPPREIRSPPMSPRINEPFLLQLMEESKLSIPASIITDVYQQFLGYVTARQKELLHEQFRIFIKNLYDSISILINSSSSRERSVGLAVIECLVDEEYNEQQDTKFLQLARFLQICIGNLIMHAPIVLGKLLKLNDSTANNVASTPSTKLDIVTFEIDRCIQWITDESSTRRTMGSMILREIAVYASADIYPYIAIIFDKIWVSLTDAHLETREAATSALCSLIELVNRKGLEGSHKRLNLLLEKANEGSTGSVETIHGSLLVLRSLCLHSSDFLSTHFEEVAELILRHKDHKDRLIRITVMESIPVLATSCVEQFVISHRHTCINYLVTAAKKDHLSYFRSALKPSNEIGYAYISLGKLALTLKHEITPYLDQIMAVLQQGMSKLPLKIPPPKEILLCVRMLAEGVRAELCAHLNGILPVMFEVGCNLDVAETLLDILQFTPGDYTSIIEDWLLQSFSIMLNGSPFFDPGTPASLRKKKEMISRNASTSSLSSMVTVEGSYTTLSSQNSQVELEPDQLCFILSAIRKIQRPTVDLLDFLESSISQFLKHQNGKVRMETSLVCLYIIEPAAAGKVKLHNHNLSSSIFTPPVPVPNHFATLQIDPPSSVGTVPSGFTASNDEPEAATYDVRLTQSMENLKIQDREEISNLTLSVDAPFPPPPPSNTEEEEDSGFSFSVNSVFSSPATSAAKRCAKLFDLVLGLAVADRDKSVRLKVFQVLSTGFEYFLCLADCLQKLLYATNDELYEIRELAVMMLGNLSKYNPALALPPLRRILAVHMRRTSSSSTASSSDTHLLKESVQIIAVIIKSAEHFVMQYMDPLTAALLPKLRDPSPEVAVQSLVALGELARVGGPKLSIHNAAIIKAVIDMLKNATSSSRLETILQALGVVIKHTGEVITPFQMQPDLLDILFELAASISDTARLEVMKLLGTIGAFDPHAFKLQSNRVSNSVLGTIGSKTQKNSLATEVQIDSDKLESATADTAGIPMGNLKMCKELRNLKPSSSVYNYTLVLCSMLRILQSDIFREQHLETTRILVDHFFQTHGPHHSNLLNILVNLLQYHVKKGDTIRRKNSFILALASLVDQGKHQMRAHVGRIADTIRENMHVAECLGPLCVLLERAAIALGEDFQPIIQQLLPSIVGLVTEQGYEESVLQFLHAVEHAGWRLSSCLDLVIPAVVDFTHVDCAGPVRNAAVRALSTLSMEIDVGDYACNIVHALSDVLDRDSSRAKSGFEQNNIDNVVVDSLAILACRLGSRFEPFLFDIRAIMNRRGLVHLGYEGIESKLLSGGYVPPEYGRDPYPKSSNDGDAAKGFADGKPGAEENTGSSFSDFSSLGHQMFMRQFSSPGSPPPSRMQNSNKMDESMLMQCWSIANCFSQEDWIQWKKKLWVELLRECESPPLRACRHLAQVNPWLSQELCEPVFYSVWVSITDKGREDMLNSVERLFQSSNVPPVVLQQFLGVVEYMEKNDCKLPLDCHLLGQVAKRCGAHAKALRYLEAQYRSKPAEAIGSLISVYSKLGQTEAATALQESAESLHGLQIELEWYEKLDRWDEGLAAYEKVLKLDPFNETAVVGKARCLRSLGQWVELDEMAQSLIYSISDTAKEQVTLCWAVATLWMHNWDRVKELCASIPTGETRNICMAAAFLAEGKYDEAVVLIHEGRKLIEPIFRGLCREGYQRTYHLVILMQLLTEMEEVVEYRISDREASPLDQEKMLHLKKVWNARLLGAEPSVRAWRNLISIRRLALLNPVEQLEMELRYVAICQRERKFDLSRQLLESLAGVDLTSAMSSQTVDPKIRFHCMQHVWLQGGQSTAIEACEAMIGELEQSLDVSPEFLAGCYIALSEGLQRHIPHQTNTISMERAIPYALKATQCTKESAEAWHTWAYVNFEVAKERHAQQQRRIQDEESTQEGIVPIDEQVLIVPHVLAAMKGFGYAISLRSNSAGMDDNLQDTLQLLSLWFTFGSILNVQNTMTELIPQISIDIWLPVLPQIIAHIAAPNQLVREQVRDLLVDISKDHVQILLYPLCVAVKSENPVTRSVAASLINTLAKENGPAIQAAQLVSEELVRISSLWHEQWRDAIDEACRALIEQDDPDEFGAILEKAFVMIDRAPETRQEEAFLEAFGQQLLEAREATHKFIDGCSVEDCNIAVDIFADINRRVVQQMEAVKELDIECISPKLATVCNVPLAIPGQYHPSGFPTIHSFGRRIRIVNSKQRPRKISILGSNGKEYVFLLKAHEDLRQDERVMQLFGLINNMLIKDRTVSGKYRIERLSVCPLSSSVGVIGWAMHHDTFYELIFRYRTQRNIVVDVERRLASKFCEPWEGLPLINKIEVFRVSQEATSGMDLDRMLWLTSDDSEAWLSRRVNFTNSSACMSMAGYILGLGDRHPSNIMISRTSGSILHIDFGDCFETAMNRKRFAEKVPFRLTRMFVNAMDAGGIQGTFTTVCERVMQVLRRCNQVVMAMLEAFVYDPLLSWRIVNTPSASSDSFDDETMRTGWVHKQEQGDWDSQTLDLIGDLVKIPRLKRSGSETLGNPDEDEELQSKVQTIMKRISAKLTGTDWGPSPIGVKEQVNRLIEQATNEENLCQMYTGWLSAW